MSPRERKIKILDALSQGYSMREIAKIVGLASPSSVHAHIKQFKQVDVLSYALKPLLESAVISINSSVNTDEACLMAAKAIIHGFKIKSKKTQK